jgi:hypothetical protein
MKIDPRDVIEAARLHARESRDLLLPAAEGFIEQIKAPEFTKRETLLGFLQQRMDLVMDCYLTGAAEMLKRLNGDTIPEPWAEEYNHQARLTELLKKYDLLA